MRFTNRLANRQVQILPSLVAVAMLVANLPGNVFAQNISQSSIEPASRQPNVASNLDFHLDTAKQLLLEIDSSAQACIEESKVDSCSTFAALLDTKFIDSYLEHCLVVADWIESLVAGLEVEVTETNNEAATSQRLLTAEFACGDQAVVKRTKYVASAFEKWMAVNRVSAGRTQAQPSFRANDDQVVESIRTQQTRLDQEIRQQWQRVEIENIRQQINSRVDYSGSTFPR